MLDDNGIGVEVGVHAFSFIPDNLPWIFLSFPFLLLFLLSILLLLSFDSLRLRIFFGLHGSFFALSRRKYTKPKLFENRLIRFNFVI